MIASFPRTSAPKDLYFLLTNSISLFQPKRSKTYKIAGVYSLHKSGRCYYVGQSKNMPSRIAQHLTGRYEYCDEVRLFLLNGADILSFYDLSKELQTAVLEANESHLMTIYKPIENLKIDYSYKIDPEYSFDSILREEPKHDLTIYVNDEHITTVSDAESSVMEIDERALNSYESMINDIALDLDGGDA